MFSHLQEASLNYQKGSIECISDVVDEIMVAKVMFSPSCFVYEDEETNRPVPGTLDINKFSNETLQECFKFITKKVKLTIGETSIGDHINSPRIINKPIYVYDSGEIAAEILEFTFVESEC